MIIKSSLSPESSSSLAWPNNNSLAQQTVRLRPQDFHHGRRPEVPPALRTTCVHLFVCLQVKTNNKYNAVEDNEDRLVFPNNSRPFIKLSLSLITNSSVQCGRTSGNRRVVFNCQQDFDGGTVKKSNQVTSLAHNVPPPLSALTVLMNERTVVEENLN